MKTIYISLILLLLSFDSVAQNALIIKSPNLVPTEDKRTKIFLGGSIDLGKAENWQAKVEQSLSNSNVILLNPRRDDWNKDWKPVSSDKNFRIQVEWELNALEQADYIIMYFAPQSQSPISLLELGLYAKNKKLLVVCPEGFWRKGNVDIVCEKYKIEMFDSIDSLLNTLKTKIR